MREWVGLLAWLLAALPRGLDARSSADCRKAALEID